MIQSGEPWDLEDEELQVSLKFEDLDGENELYMGLTV